MGGSVTQKAVVDWSECGIVEHNARIQGGRPVLRGTRMPVDDIVDNYQAGVEEEEIAEIFEIPLEQVHQVLIYAAQHNVAPRPV